MTNFRVEFDEVKEKTLKLLEQAVAEQSIDGVARTTTFAIELTAILTNFWARVGQLSGTSYQDGIEEFKEKFWKDVMELTAKGTGMDLPIGSTVEETTH